VADPQSDIREAIEATRAELSERLDALSDRAASVASQTISEGTKRARASRRQVGRQAKSARRRAAQALPDASTLSDAKARLGDLGGWAADSTASAATVGGRKAKARAADAGRTAKVKGRKAKAEARRAAAVAEEKTRSGGRTLRRLVLVAGAAAAVVVSRRQK
jgi:hypothetical protein